jgi:DNA modification methylase
MSKVELHLGDCLTYMRTMAAGSVDCVLTDPPYGINLISGGGRGMNGWRNFKSDGDWDKVRPGKEYFDEMLRIGKTVIIWGGNYFTDCLPPSQCWLIWDKGQRDFSLADGEMAWTNRDRAMRIFSYPRAAMLKENGFHPTQKPIALMRWCMELVEAKDVFDPFMGSGSTGIAAAQLNIPFSGCEIDERYFAIAKRRIEIAQMQPNLFEAQNGQ